MSKKGLAVDSIMQIFLMVAVLAVAVSFLLRAFNIDLFGFLEDLFGQAGVPDVGKALHIKLRPEDNNEIVVKEFHLTNENVHLQEETRVLFGVEPLKSYFQISTGDFANQNSCIIFTTRERTPPLATDLGQDDLGSVYYVKPGTSIQQDSCNGQSGGSLGACIKDLVVESGCERVKLGVVGKFNIGVSGIPEEHKICAEDKERREIEDQKFTPLAKDFKGTCGKNRAICNLLKEDSYEVKYGLLCGGDGKWHVCNKKAAKIDEHTFSSKRMTVTATCVPELSGEYYIWRVKEVGLTASASLQTTIGGQVIDRPSQLINNPVGLTISAQNPSGPIEKLSINLDEMQSVKDNCVFDGTYSGLLAGGRNIEYTACDTNEKTCSASWDIKCAKEGKYKFRGVAVFGDRTMKTNEVEITYERKLSHTVDLFISKSGGMAYTSLESGFKVKLSGTTERSGQEIILDGNIHAKDADKDMTIISKTCSFTTAPCEIEFTKQDIIDSLNRFHILSTSELAPDKIPTLKFSYKVTLKDGLTASELENKEFDLGIDSSLESPLYWKKDPNQISPVTISFLSWFDESQKRDVKHGTLSIEAFHPDIGQATILFEPPENIQVTEGLFFSFKGDGNSIKVRICDSVKCAFKTVFTTETGGGQFDYFRYFYITKGDLEKGGVNPAIINRVEIVFNNDVVIDGLYWK